jgi:hypothetical protein
MKYFTFLVLTILISGCFLLKNEKLMAKKILSNGIIIELYYTGGGATDSDIIWIKKINKDGQETRIGKIKGFNNSDSFDIRETDKNHIRFRFVTKEFPESPVNFLINLNDEIKGDGTSPFNQAQ